MFSDREEKVIKAIGRKKVTFEEIAVDIFRNDKDKPFDTRITISNTVRRIIKKCEFYKLAWTLEKTKVGAFITVSKVKVNEAI